MNNTLVLDTHVWIWLNEGISKKLPLKIVEEIEKTAMEGTILIPAICLWEISMLKQKERIVLSLPLNQWFHNTLNKSGIELAPLTPEIAMESSQLPGNFQSLDPSDRMIIATTRIHDAVLITADEKIRDYAKNGYVKIIPI